MKERLNRASKWGWPSPTDAPSFSVKRSQVEFHNFASLGDTDRAIAHYFLRATAPAPWPAPAAIAPPTEAETYNTGIAAAPAWNMPD